MKTKAYVVSIQLPTDLPIWEYNNESAKLILLAKKQDGLLGINVDSKCKCHIMFSTEQDAKAFKNTLKKSGRYAVYSGEAWINLDKIQKPLAPRNPEEQELWNALNKIEELQEENAQLRKTNAEIIRHGAEIKVQLQELKTMVAVADKQAKNHEDQLNAQIEQLRKFNRKLSHDNAELAAELMTVVRGK